MSLSCYLVESALYGSLIGLAIMLASGVVGFGGLAIYLLFGW